MFGLFQGHRHPSMEGLGVTPPFELFELLLHVGIEALDTVRGPEGPLEGSVQA